MLHKFSKVLNLIQASVNQSCSVLGYVVKQKACSELKESGTVLKNNDNTPSNSSSDHLEYYEASIVEFKSIEKKIHLIEKDKVNQIRVQFLYKEKHSTKSDKLMVLIHQECK